MSNPLMEKALRSRRPVKPRKLISVDMEEVMVAYLDRKITSAQLGAALGVSTANAQTKAGFCLINIYRQGRIIIKPRKEQA